MIRALLPSLLIASLGPASLGVPDPAPVMFFDVRRVLTVEEMIVRESTLQGVPSHLAITVAWRESRFDPLAHNKRSGAAGLFQLMPHTAKVLHVSDRFDARQSSIAGLGLLGNYLRFGGEKYAMCAFARGTGACQNSRLERR